MFKKLKVTLGASGTGKTALGVKIAQDSAFPFVRVISPENMIGYHDNAKCQAIKKVNHMTIM